MGFFDSLRRVLGSEKEPTSLDQVKQSWGLDEPESASPGSDSGLYDQTNWLKKLKRILGGLPDSRPEWGELMSEARALNLDPKWVTESQVAEFMLLIRRAVADRVFTEPEHRKLDLARDLIGIPEPEAEAALQTIIAEAESFFGKPVEGA